jgi:hypothetical protein
VIVTILHDEDIVAALFDIVIDIVIIATGVLDLKLFARRLRAVNSDIKNIVTYTSSNKIKIPS